MLRLTTAPGYAQASDPADAESVETIQLTFDVTADSVRFDAPPSLVVGVGNDPPVDLFLDNPACVFQPGTTYRGVRLRLEAGSARASLTCGGGEPPPDPAAATAEAVGPTTESETTQPGGTE